jgi:hypothetical protein
MSARSMILPTCLARVALLALLAVALMASECSGSGAFDDPTRRSGGSQGSGQTLAAPSGDPGSQPGPGPTIPEPSGFLLFAVGAALAGGALRRARRR